MKDEEMAKSKSIKAGLGKYGFKPFNVFMRIFFVFSTILTIQDIYWGSYLWEMYTFIWIWNFVDVTSIFENIYCIFSFYSKKSENRESAVKMWASNLLGVLACSFMLVVTSISISDPTNRGTKLLVSDLSFATAMFGSSAPAFVGLLWNLGNKDLTFGEKICQKNVSFQKHNLWLTIEWFIAGIGSIGNSFHIDLLTTVGYGTAASLKFISLCKSAYDICAKAPETINYEDEVKKTALGDAYEEEHTSLTREEISFNPDLDIKQAESSGIIGQQE